MRKFIFIIILLFIASCTTTKYVEVPIETIKKEYVTNTKIDSVYIQDSIDRFIKGDTLILHHYKTQYKYLNTVDTVIKTDTITNTVTIEKVKVKEVNKIKWYQNILMYTGFAAIIILILYLIKKIRI